MIDYATHYADVEKYIGIALKNGNATPPCGKGCFSCCREPVFATRRQVEYILDALTQEQREALIPKLQIWLRKFLESGLQHRSMEKLAFDYRPKFIFCPFLGDNGQCGVYDRRPLECRLHYARKTKEGCDHDGLRPHQEFLEFPEIVQFTARTAINSLGIGEKDTYDHLGVMLAEKLLGYVVTTPCRMITEKVSAHEVTIYMTEDNAEFCQRAHESKLQPK